MHEAKLGMELRHANLIQSVRTGQRPCSALFHHGAFHGLPLENADRPAKYLPDAQEELASNYRASWISGLRTCMISGWIHRDVKPENILYNKSGEVRVIDHAL